VGEDSHDAGRRSTHAQDRASDTRFQTFDAGRRTLEQPGRRIDFGFQPPLIALVLSRAGNSSAAIGAVTAASLVASSCSDPSTRTSSRAWAETERGRGNRRRRAHPAVHAAHAEPSRLVRLEILHRLRLGELDASEIWLNTVSGNDARGTVMGVYGTVFSIGIVAGPSLLEFTGTRGWQPFAAGAVA